jgi:glutamine amidotransferase
MITVINYGLGNVMAFVNAYNQLGIPVKVAKTSADLEKATKLILPGVGSFDHAMREFNHSGMRNEIERLVFDKLMPILGVCVGMQMLANISAEGVLPGLGWLDGEVKKIDVAKIAYGKNLPHMGWNNIKPFTGNPLFQGLEHDARFYFLHSYYFECHRQEDILAITNYSNEFASAVGRNNIYGVQFHPEKSHHFGAQLLKNFSDL